MDSNLLMLFMVRDANEREWEIGTGASAKVCPSERIALLWFK